MASPPISIPLRFQRAELEAKAALGEAGLAVLAGTAHPERLVQTLAEQGERRDAIHALALILPHRQTVWWGCLAARLLPGLDRRPADLAAVVAAERWVQSGGPAEAEAAGAAAEAANRDYGPAWVATAAFWAGPSLAPRGQQPVAPLPHLPGTATRAALALLTQDPAFAGRVRFADWLPLGLALMAGGSGAEPQAALRARLADEPGAEA